MLTGRDVSFLLPRSVMKSLYIVNLLCATTK